MQNAGAASHNLPETGDKIRVMLVDDSAVVRGLMSRWLDEETNIEIVAKSRNGLQAIKDAEAHKPNIIVLDIEMPEMDGLEALPLLLRAAPGVRILIASSLSQRNAKISLTALSKGAHDYVPKPTSNSGLTTSDDFRVELITKINALCGRRVSGISPAPKREIMRERSTDRERRPLTVARAVPVTEPAPQEGGLRDFNRRRPSILCIGSSTGGPRAVQTMLAELAPTLKDLPVVITQHMPKAFTSVFAEHLEKAVGLPVKEGVDGDPLQKGHIYVAPGDRHMIFSRQAGNVQIILDDGPEVNFCKPAVDCMFTSAAEFFGHDTLGVIMTGMGHDGAKGGEKIVKAGGNVLAQDEASSIVWGMPGAAYKAGVCASLLPLSDMANVLSRVIKEGRL